MDVKDWPYKLCPLHEDVVWYFCDSKKEGMKVKNYKEPEGLHNYLNWYKTTDKSFKI